MQNKQRTDTIYIYNEQSNGLPSLHQMLKQLVAVQSVSSTSEEYDQSNKLVIDLLAQWCQDIGMTSHIQEFAPGKYNLIANLSPTNLQTKRKGIMFAGHTDTVGYTESQWHQNPFELQVIDDHWVGLGVCDMKGFFPIALTAIANTLEQHRQTKQQLQAPITLLATADEETTMAGARALAKLGTQHPHHVIIGEPSAGQAIYAHKGVLTTKLILSGIRGHASDPGMGANAIEAAHWVIGRLLSWREELQEFRHDQFKIPHPTLNLGCIHGGTNSNVICDQCEIMIDIRLLPNMQAKEVQDQLRQRLQGLDQAIPNTGVMLEVADYVPSFAETPDSPFFKFLGESTGQPLATCDFVTEAPLLQQLGHTPVVLGPGQIEWAHKPNERLSLASVPPMLATLTACLQPLFEASTAQSPGQ